MTLKYVGGPAAVLVVIVAIVVVLAGAGEVGTRTPAGVLVSILSTVAILVAVGAVVLGFFKREAAVIGARTGVRAFRVFPDGGGSVQQLVDADGWAGPASPVVCVREGALEFWRAGGVAAFASFRVEEVEVAIGRTPVMIGRFPDPIPRAALVLGLPGVAGAVTIALFSDAWWSVGAMGEDALREVAVEMGLLRE
ncbi:hypothetical protein N1031_07590 [Herbiconiux moechotypicola]|uniref:Integral membrane protein n=1 Tax=Herbiconiux moechotypicola TaxID=637393 RepID=A0ABN3DHC4_9MICO|nr:hypothetical protein [Herbiconiux moechotypicola]MCS5729620.1 hypothetical protein [Herbiconiux moechotypicola]